MKRRWLQLHHQPGPVHIHSSNLCSRPFPLFLFCFEGGLRKCQVQSESIIRARACYPENSCFICLIVSNFSPHNLVSCSLIFLFYCFLRSKQQSCICVSFTEFNDSGVLFIMFQTWRRGFLTPLMTSR